MINTWLLYGYMVTIWLTMVNNLVVVEPTPLKNMMEFVSWDDDIPNVMGTNKIYVPNHQPQFIYMIYTHYRRHHCHTILLIHGYYTYYYTLIFEV